MLLRAKSKNKVYFNPRVRLTMRRKQAFYDSVQCLDYSACRFMHLPKTETKVRKREKSKTMRQ